MAVTGNSIRAHPFVPGDGIRVFKREGGTIAVSENDLELTRDALYVSSEGNAEIAVRDNTVEDSSRGIDALTAGRVVVEGNSLRGISRSGVRARSADSTMVIANEILGRQGDDGGLDLSTSAPDGSSVARSNTISGFNFGVTTQSNTTLAFNSLAGNLPTAISHQGPGALAAENNWFGCNAGPGAPGCDAIAGTAAAEVDADPHLVLALKAPSKLRKNRSATLEATVRTNSAGETPQPFAFPDGTEIAFSATKGTLTPGTSETVGGLAQTTFKATKVGRAKVSATLDGETVTKTVRVG